jgi:hypothetical protein
MVTTFKQFLAEGGAATEKFNTQRATKEDIEKALDIVGRTLNLPDIKNRTLGTVHLTLAGKKNDSGDIDIVIGNDEMSSEQANLKMMELVNNEGTFNKGTKIGSYAVDVGGKKVQVDLMFVNDKTWAKFIYYSSEGDKSKYPGVVRNFLLMAAMRHTHEGGKDFIMKYKGEVVARASRAIKLDTGVERLFKAAKYDKETKTFGKTMNKMDPGQLAMHAQAISGKKIKFDPSPDIITDPDTVAKFLFGQNVSAKDIMTAEDVIKQIRARKDAQEIFADATKSLKEAKLPIPEELK